MPYGHLTTANVLLENGVCRCCYYAASTPRKVPKLMDRRFSTHSRCACADRLTGYENALLGYKPSNWKLLQAVLERRPRAADILQV